MATTDLFPLVLETARAFTPHYASAMGQAIEEAGMQGQDWGLLLWVIGADPHALTAARLHELVPYTAMPTLETQLADTAKRGLIAPDGDGGYRPTEQGRQGLRRSFEAVGAALAELQPLPAEDMRRLADLLRRLVEATAAADTPRDKFAFASSRLTEPGAEASRASQIDQYLTDLTRYRDDAHRAAWGPYDVSGHGWEAFTMIWREEADSSAALAHKLERRGHDEAAYAAALHDLRGRGWVDEQGGVYRVTERGRALRQAAENATDELFYAPWLCLNDGETQELRQLLAQLRDQLQRMSDDTST